MGIENKEKDTEMSGKRTGRNNTLSKRFPTKEKVLQLFLDKNNFQNPIMTKKVGDVLVADFEQGYFLLYTKRRNPTNSIETDTENREERRAFCNKRLYCGEYHTDNRVYQFATELLKKLPFQEKAQTSHFPEKEYQEKNTAYSSRRIDRNRRFWFLDN